MTTNKKEKNERRGEAIVDRFKKKVTSYGNTCHVTISKEFEGDIAEVTIKRPYLLCKGCHEVVTEKYFSKDPELCDLCFKQAEAIKNNKCLQCGGKNPLEEYWGICQKCWDKSVKEADEYNKKQGKNAIMDWDAEPIKAKEGKSKQS